MDLSLGDKFIFLVSSRILNFIFDTSIQVGIVLDFDFILVSLKILVPFFYFLPEIYFLSALKNKINKLPYHKLRNVYEFASPLIKKQIIQTVFINIEFLTVFLF